MNLYAIYPSSYDWCCYVFAETPNKAKYMLVRYFNEQDEQYIDFRYGVVGKDVGGKAEICDWNCKRLSDLGVSYAEED